MDPIAVAHQNLTRRQLLSQTGRLCLGGAALSQLLAAERPAHAAGLPQLPHFRPQAKRVIYLFFSGGPSNIDTFDFKPNLRKIHGTELPDSIRNGQRLTGMTSGQKSFRSEERRVGKACRSRRSPHH